MVCGKPQQTAPQTTILPHGVVPSGHAIPEDPPHRHSHQTEQIMAPSHEQHQTTQPPQRVSVDSGTSDAFSRLSADDDNSDDDDNGPLSDGYEPPDDDPSDVRAQPQQSEPTRDLPPPFPQPIASGPGLGLPAPATPQMPPYLPPGWFPNFDAGTPGSVPAGVHQPGFPFPPVAAPQMHTPQHQTAMPHGAAPQPMPHPAMQQHPGYVQQPQWQYPVHDAAQAYPQYQYGQGDYAQAAPVPRDPRRQQPAAPNNAASSAWGPGNVQQEWSQQGYDNVANYGPPGAPKSGGYPPPEVAAGQYGSYYGQQPTDPRSSGSTQYRGGGTYGSGAQKDFGIGGQSDYGRGGQGDYGRGQNDYGRGQSDYGRGGQSDYGRGGQSDYGRGGQSDYGRGGQSYFRRADSRGRGPRRGRGWRGGNSWQQQSGSYSGESQEDRSGYGRFGRSYEPEPSSYDRKSSFSDRNSFRQSADQQEEPSDNSATGDIRNQIANLFSGVDSGDKQSAGGGGGWDDSSDEDDAQKPREVKPAVPAKQQLEIRASNDVLESRPAGASSTGGGGWSSEEDSPGRPSHPQQKLADNMDHSAFEAKKIPPSKAETGGAWSDDSDSVGAASPLPPPVAIGQLKKAMVPNEVLSRRPASPPREAKVAEKSKWDDDSSDESPKQLPPSAKMAQVSPARAKPQSSWDDDEDELSTNANKSEPVAPASRFGDSNSSTCKQRGGGSGKWSSDSGASAPAPARRSLRQSEADAETATFGQFGSGSGGGNQRFGSGETSRFGSSDSNRFGGSGDGRFGPPSGDGFGGSGGRFGRGRGSFGRGRSRDWGRGGRGRGFSYGRGGGGSFKGSDAEGESDRWNSQGGYKSGGSGYDSQDSWSAQRGRSRGRGNDSISWQSRGSSYRRSDSPADGDKSFGRQPSHATGGNQEALVGGIRFGKQRNQSESSDPPDSLPKAACSTSGKAVGGARSAWDQNSDEEEVASPAVSKRKAPVSCAAAPKSGWDSEDDSRPPSKQQHMSKQKSEWDEDSPPREQQPARDQKTSGGWDSDSPSPPPVRKHPASLKPTCPTNTGWGMKLPPMEPETRFAASGRVQDQWEQPSPPAQPLTGSSKSGQGNSGWDMPSPEQDHAHVSHRKSGGGGWDSESPSPPREQVQCQSKPNYRKPLRGSDLRSPEFQKLMEHCGGSNNSARPAKPGPNAPAGPWSDIDSPEDEFEPKLEPRMPTKAPKKRPKKKKAKSKFPKSASDLEEGELSSSSSRDDFSTSGSPSPEPVLSSSTSFSPADATTSGGGRNQQEQQSGSGTGGDSGNTGRSAAPCQQLAMHSASGASKIGPAVGQVEQPPPPACQLEEPANMHLSIPLPPPPPCSPKPPRAQPCEPNTSSSLDCDVSTGIEKERRKQNVSPGAWQTSNVRKDYHSSPMKDSSMSRKSGHHGFYPGQNKLPSTSPTFYKKARSPGFDRHAVHNSYSGGTSSMQRHHSRSKSRGKLSSGSCSSPDTVKRLQKTPGPKVSDSESDREGAEAIVRKVLTEKRARKTNRLAVDPLICDKRILAIVRNNSPQRSAMLEEAVAAGEMTVIDSASDSEAENLTKEQHQRDRGEDGAVEKRPGLDYRIAALLGTSLSPPRRVAPESDSEDSESSSAASMGDMSRRLNCIEMAHSESEATDRDIRMTGSKNHRSPARLLNKPGAMPISSNAASMQQGPDLMAQMFGAAAFTMACMGNMPFMPLSPHQLEPSAHGLPTSGLSQVRAPLPPHVRMSLVCPPPPPPPPSLVPRPDPGVKATDTTVDHFVRELIQKLETDLMKRMISAHAFPFLDNWWNKQQTAHRLKSTALTVSTDAASETRTESITKLFSPDFNLGLRASIPKMPSFKRKVLRPPSPPAAEEFDNWGVSEGESDAEKSDGIDQKTDSTSSSSSETSDSEADAQVPPAAKLTPKSKYRRTASREGREKDKVSPVDSKIKDTSAPDDNAPVPVSLGTFSDEGNSSKPVANNRKGVEDESDDSEETGESSGEDESSSEPSDVESEDEEKAKEDQLEDSSKEADKENRPIVRPRPTARPELTDATAKQRLPPAAPPDIDDLEDQFCMRVTGEYNPLLYDHRYAAPYTGEDADDKLSTPARRPSVPKRKPSSISPVTARYEGFQPRSLEEEDMILKSLLLSGLDDEDRMFLNRSYERISEDNAKDFEWTQNVKWIDIPSEPPSPKRSRRDSWPDTPTVHDTGCARTQGYYKQSVKRTFLTRARRADDDESEQTHNQVMDINKTRQLVQSNREARAMQRRLLNTFGDVESDLLKFNQLKFRKKQVRFGRSQIHNWGLYSLEDIGADEMIIEYVGQMVRLTVAERREKGYEKRGIGSSYLFRIDGDHVIDATKRGNLARFINHCCNPNCYARIVSVEGQKKIVIYSKQPIAANEEITYDYKFPLEDVKIPCNCGAPNCRRSLN